MSEPIVPIKEVVVPSIITTPIVIEEDPLIQKDKEIAKLSEERDNYKVVALKRLGKLPGDADFMKGADESTGLTVEETVKKALLDNEISRRQNERETEINKILRENAELKLALKGKQGIGFTGGNDGGTTVEVKDNVFSATQLEALTAKAKKLGADPVKFIERAKNNFSARR
jgi:hypothetical protein